MLLVPFRVETLVEVWFGDDGRRLGTGGPAARSGPYTLGLTKTDALFDRERQQRERDPADLAWLNTNYPVGPGTKTARRPHTGIRSLQPPPNTSVTWWP